MNNLYLIAHKVRGAPAFDIATRCECPECLSMGCPECDDLGYWWIVPTSGHRAYPYWDAHFNQIDWAMFNVNGNPLPEMPPDLPDHYPHRAAPTLSLTEALGLAKPTPPAPIVRRF